MLAPELGPPGRFRLVHDTEQLGVRLVTGAAADDLTPRSTVTPGRRRGHRSSAPICRPERTLADELAELLAPLGRPVHVIGDAARHRPLEAALADARRTAAIL